MLEHNEKDWLIDWRVWLAIICLVALGTIGLIWWIWDWLYSDAMSAAAGSATTDSSAGESNSEVLRNAGFLVGGVLALVFALWRALVATRQADAAQGQATAAITQAEIAQQQAEAAQQQAEAAQQQAEIARQTAQQQVEVAQQQAEIARQTAQQQVETAQQSLLNERYRRGTEMLGNDVLRVRIAGSYELQHLAEEHPAQYHIQIMSLLCAFVRNPPPEDGEPANSREELRPDVQAAISAIGERGSDAQRIEAEADFRLDLRGVHLEYAERSELNFADADLRGAYLIQSDLVAIKLSHAALTDANLSDANLTEANLASAHLLRANLSDADLTNADLRRANLTNANLSGTDLSDADLDGAIVSGAVLGATPTRIAKDQIIRSGRYTRVSQHQLDQTLADPNNPPSISDGATDPETGDPLVWRGRPFNPRY